jgi:predicted nucleic acid-binding protein
MKLYLDACSLQRPLDNKAQVRIALETEAVLAILTLCESGQHMLLSSATLVFEIEQIPQPQRKALALEIVSRAAASVALNEQIEQRAKDLERRGIKSLDALHLASAEAEPADYFCTCDDRLLKKAKTLTDLRVRVLSPLELIQELQA